MPNVPLSPDSPRILAVFFDLDGTLLDSFEAHFQAYKDMFSQFDIRVSKKKFLQTYSPDWYRTYEAFGLPRDQWKLADRYWLHAVADHKPALLPGVRRTLRQLGRSMRLGLVSSGSKHRVMKDLVRNQILDFFEIIVTGDDTRSPKPHPEALLKAIDRMGVKRSEALFVGDAAADYEMARSAGVSFVGVKSAFSGFKPKSCPVIRDVGGIPLLLKRNAVRKYLRAKPPR